MKRFRFLQLLILNIVFVTICMAQKGTKKLFSDVPGMVSYTYRKSLEKNTDKALDTIQSLGIKDMEFSNLFGHSAEGLRELLDKHSIKCSSLGVTYDEALNKTEEVGRNAKLLGADFVRVAWIPHGIEFTLADAKKAANDFNSIGKILKEKFGLSFCYHNHGYEFQTYADGTLYDYLVKNTDPQYVSLELDILWAFFPGQDPESLIKKYSSRIKLLHLKDLRKGIKGNLSGSTAVDNDVALGQGQLNIPAILRAAQKANVKHYYIEDESPYYHVQVSETIRYVKGLTTF